MATVSSEMCKSWEKSGKKDFLKIFKALIASTEDEVGPIPAKLKRVVYDLCWHVLKGALTPDQALSAFSEMHGMHNDFIFLLADIISIIDTETNLIEDAKDPTREKFLTLATSCVSLLTDCVLKERLDQETLENLGLVTSKQQFQQKYVKMKTKLYYKQQKFNLLREEMEGYSKLVTELLEGPQSNTEKVLEDIKCLVGCFNLDPNRVLDILLEAFECRPQDDDFFIPLLQSYTADLETLCHILGFKFHFYQVAENSETPESLYRIVALMLYHGLVDLDTLYPHLIPNDAEIITQQKKDLAEAKAYAKKLNVVSLAAAEKDKHKDDKNEKIIDVWQNNQKLGLVEALLRIGDWSHARWLMDRYPPFLATSHEPVALALSQLVHYMVEPLYLKNNNLPSVLLKKRPTPSLPHQKAAKQISSFSALRDEVFPLLRYLGPNVSYDPTLMVKIIRFAKVFMAKKEGCSDPMLLGDLEDTFRGFLTITDELLLPALSLLPAHCCMSEELWSFIKMLNYEYRYRLYGQWKNESHNMLPKLTKARADTIDKAKYIMKRLAKENVKPLGRQIGKLSHSNPGVMFEYILTQIQKYDNFIGPVVDSLKFLTNLSYDVLAYCLIEALANPERERMKFDDTNISMWLQSLASFCGAIFKKYQIELTGLLQYVANQLKAGKSYDLLILREVIQKMAGIEVTEEITEDQLHCMGGGELLKTEGGQYAQVRNMKKSANRLKEILVAHNLAIPLALLMAQQRHNIVFQDNFDDSDKRHLKLVGKLSDTCQDTFVQFSTFLGSQLSTEELRSRLPPMDALFSQYYLTADSAFPLCRSLYTLAIQNKFDEFRKADKKDKTNTTTGAKTQRYVEAANLIMEPIAELIQPLFPEKVWEDLSPGFYTTFWSLTMYDLHVPNNAYEKQVTQLKTQLITIDESKDLNPSKKKREKERCIALIEKLQDEEKKQQEHVNRVITLLKHNKEKWFITGVHKHATITSLIQMCLFPRCCMTAVDAIYCAKFLYILHNLKTPNFSSLICYDRTFSDITWAMSSCTENEAHRYGRFLNAILNDIMRWHSNKDIYDKECGSYPGFKTVFRKESQNSVADQLDYENYRHVVHKWHYSLAKVMVFCMESGDYIQIRNSLIVLTKILPNYPRIVKFGHALERRIDRVCQEEKEKRPDLYALAMGYSVQLKRGKKSWVSDAEFHIIDKKPVPKTDTKKDAEKKVVDDKSSSAKKKASLDKQDSLSFSAKKEKKEEKKEEKKVKPEKITMEKEKSYQRITFEVEPKPDDTKKEKKEKRHSKSKEKKTEKDEERKSKEEKRESRASTRERDGRGDRSGSVHSGESGAVRRSAEPSPRHPDENRESKRRKLDSSKKDRNMDKRDRSQDETNGEHKRHKTEESKRVSNGREAGSSGRGGTGHKAARSLDREAAAAREQESERERYNREREREWGGSASWTDSARDWPDEDGPSSTKRSKKESEERESRRGSDKHKKSKHH